MYKNTSIKWIIDKNPFGLNFFNIRTSYRYLLVIMNDEFKLPISEEIYKKIAEIGKSLNLDMKDIVNVAFHELFDLILNDPLIFLEKIGLIEKLKKISLE